MTDNNVIDPQSRKATEEDKIGLIKRAISSKEGWDRLGKGIMGAKDPAAAKQTCVDLLRKIAGDKMVKIPITDGEELEGPYADLLVWELEKHL